MLWVQELGSHCGKLSLQEWQLGGWEEEEEEEGKEEKEKEEDDLQEEEEGKWLCGHLG
jgi:hypothetical protein